MLPQPHPNATTPLASEAALRSRRYWKGLWIVGVISIIGVLGLLCAPLVVRSHRNEGQTEVVSNARQIGLALFEFETEYGSYPDETTIGKVRLNQVSDLELGTKSSNDFFRQLLASGIAGNEAIFYAKTFESPKKNRNSGVNKVLEKGEVGFSYLSGLSAEGSPSRPLVVTPLIPGTDRFDAKMFDGKAVILKMDNSVISANINKDGHVLINGRNVLDPGHPIWGGKPWKLVWPE